MSTCSFPVFQEQEGEWTSSKTFLMEGIPIHDFFTPNPVALRDYIVNFQTRGDDVVVVTYPKSGKLLNSGSCDSRNCRQLYNGPFHFVFAPPPPPIEGLKNLWGGREEVFNGHFCGGNCVGTSDLLINLKGKFVSTLIFLS